MAKDTLDKCFHIMQCPEERKVDLAVFSLQGEVEDWWTLEENKGRRVDWEDSKEIFNGKYFSETYRDDKRDEFLHLKQWELSVAEYEKKFTELAKYLWR